MFTAGYQGVDLDLSQRPAATVPTMQYSLEHVQHPCDTFEEPEEPQFSYDTTHTQFDRAAYDGTVGGYQVLAEGTNSTYNGDIPSGGAFEPVATQYPLSPRNHAPLEPEDQFIAPEDYCYENYGPEQWVYNPSHPSDRRGDNSHDYEFEYQRTRGDVGYSEPATRPEDHQEYRYARHHQSTSRQIQTFEVNISPDQGEYLTQLDVNRAPNQDYGCHRVSAWPTDAATSELAYKEPVSGHGSRSLFTASDDRNPRQFDHQERWHSNRPSYGSNGNVGHAEAHLLSPVIQQRYDGSGEYTRSSAEEILEGESMPDVRCHLDDQYGASSSCVGRFQQSLKGHDLVRLLSDTNARNSPHGPNTIADQSHRRIAKRRKLDGRPKAGSGLSLDQLILLKAAAVPASTAIKTHQEAARDFFRSQNINVPEPEPQAGSRTTPPLMPTQDPVPEKHEQIGGGKADLVLANPAWYNKMINLPSLELESIQVLTSMRLVQNRPLHQALRAWFDPIEYDGPLQNIDLVLSASTAAMFRKVDDLLEHSKELVEELREAAKYYRRVIAVFEVAAYHQKHRLSGTDDDGPSLSPALLSAIPAFRRAVAISSVSDHGLPLQIELVFAVSGAEEVIKGLRGVLEEEFGLLRAAIGDREARQVCEDRAWLNTDPV